MLRGDPSAVGIVHRWIETVLQQSFPSIARDWEDLRQEVVTRLYRNLRRGDFRAQAQLRTYVHQITRNVCIDHLRRVRREQTGFAAGSTVHPSLVEVPDPSIRDLLDRILESLTRRERRLLYLVHVECLSYEEVARQLGISAAAVKVRVFRCRQKLMKQRQRLLRRKK